MIIPTIQPQFGRAALQLIDLTTGSTAATLGAVVCSGQFDDVYTTMAVTGDTTCFNPSIAELGQGNPSDGFSLTFSSSIANDFRIKINGKIVQDERRCLPDVGGISYRYYDKLHSGDFIEVDVVAVGCTPSGTGSMFNFEALDVDGYVPFSLYTGNTNTFAFEALSGLGTGTYTLSGTYRNLAAFSVNLPPRSFSLGLYEYLDGSQHQFNTGWRSSSDALLLSGSPYPPTGNDPAIYDKVYPGVLINYRPSNTNNSQTLKINTLTGAPYALNSGVFGNDSAWLSYDVSSGVNTKKVFAYSLTMLDNLSGLSGQNPFIVNIPPVLTPWSPALDTSFCASFNFQKALSGCKSPDPQEAPNQVCLTGVVTDNDLKIAIDAAKARAGLKTGQGSNFDVQNALDNNPVANSFAIYTGSIVFNIPVTGDYFTFLSYGGTVDTYNFDYYSIYQTDPPYPLVSGRWDYGVDYTGIDDLISAINADLSGVSYPVWQNIECVRTEGSGYYESGPLVYATKSGDNTILLKAAQVGKAGKYTWTFHSGDRSVPHQLPILKYLLPTTVKLQGANVYGSWTDLDSHSNVDWTKIIPIEVEIPILLPAESGNAKPTPVTGQQVTASGEPEKKLIYTLTVTGKDKCGADFSDITEFYQSPSSTGCKTPQEKDDDDKKLNDLASDGAGETVQMVIASYLKTGWKFTDPQDYNYYRIVLDDFISQAAGFSPTYSNEFSLTNINFYGVVTGFDSFSGSMCLVGANYTGYIEGYASGVITGNLYEDATVASHGVANFKDVLVSGVPNGGGLVRFNKLSGVAQELFTGVYNGSVTGTGFYTESVGGYFYNPTIPAIEFSRLVSGYITGSGNLIGGPYLIVTNSGISSITGFQIVVGSAYGLASGIVPNFYANFSDVPSFGYLNGTLSGTVTTGNQGHLTFSLPISGVPAQAYSFIVSGTDTAHAKLNYNSPQEGDSIYINNVIAIYSTGSGHNAPTYFNNINQLADIINSGSDSLGVSASVTGSSVYLAAISLGTSGNGIPLAVSGSTGCPYFDGPQTSGGNTYFYPVTPTNLFTGIVEQTLYATGIYTTTASGYVTGTIKQLDFVREFTGVWNLKTGVEDFRSNGWFAGSSYTNYGIVTSMFSGHPDILPIQVIYNNSPLVTTIDLVKLTVTGYNFNSGVSVILSGQY